MDEVSLVYSKMFVIKNDSISNDVELNDSINCNFIGKKIRMVSEKSVTKIISLFMSISMLIF